MIAEGVRGTREDGGGTLRIENWKPVSARLHRVQEFRELVGSIHAVDDQGDRVGHEPEASFRLPTATKCRPRGGGQRVKQEVRVPERPHAAEAAIDVGGDPEQDLHQYVLVGGHPVSPPDQFVEPLIPKDIGGGKPEPRQPPEGPVQIDRQSILPAALHRMGDAACQWLKPGGQ